MNDNKQSMIRWLRGLFYIQSFHMQGMVGLANGIVEGVKE